MSGASLRPWGRAAVIGSTVSALTIGIAARWRETVVDIIEQQPNPDYENFLFRRCVLSQNSIQLLQDAGVTAGALAREGHLRPAGAWRFVTDDGLDVIREGTSYPGCAPAEATFHIPYGALVRALRREFLRFGGVVNWGARAGRPFVMPDGSGFLGIEAEFGAINEVEAIVGTSTAHAECTNYLFGADTWKARPTLKFPCTTGYCMAADVPADAMERCFPAGRDVDFVIVLGRRCALHMFRTRALNTRDANPPEVVSWRLTSLPTGADDAAAAAAAGGGKAQPQQRASNEPVMSTLHPSIKQVFARSKAVVHDVACVPTASCALLPDAESSRVTVAGNCLLPVDLFEFRGDSALVAIEDSCALVRRLYKDTYYRGFVPVDFREHEMDTIARRTKLIQRDLQDVEVFLNAAEQITDNKKAAREAKSQEISN